MIASKILDKNVADSRTNLAMGQILGVIFSTEETPSWYRCTDYITTMWVPEMSTTIRTYQINILHEAT